MLEVSSWKAGLFVAYFTRRNNCMIAGIGCQSKSNNVILDLFPQMRINNFVESVKKQQAILALQVEFKETLRQRVQLQVSSRSRFDKISDRNANSTRSLSILTVDAEGN